MQTVTGTARGFTSGEAANFGGISKRQIQWWDECGVIRPVVVSHRRVFTSEQLVELSILGALRKRSFSLQRIRQGLAELRNKRIDLKTAIAGKKWLVAGIGKRFYLFETADEVCTLLEVSTENAIIIRIPQMKEAVR